MDKSSSSRVPRSHAQEKFTMTLRKRHHQDAAGPKKKKVIKLEDQTDGNEEEMEQTTAMTIGATTTTGQFVRLPPEILTMVLGNLKCSDLLSCRKINKTWRVLTTSNLRLITKLGLYENDDVAVLNRCLKISKKFFSSLDSFPCTQFKIYDMKLSGNNWQIFFNLYGTSIQSLTLRFVEIEVEDGQLKALNRLLTQQAPNIKHVILERPTSPLELVRYNLEKLKKLLNRRKNTNRTGLSDMRFDNQQIKLPHLETLSQIGYCSEYDKNIMEKLVASAPNLKVYNTSTPLDDSLPLDMLMSTGKIHTLKKIEMSLDNPMDIEFCDEFANMKPKLESFKCSKLDPERLKSNPEFLKSVMAIINKILQSSKDTLIHMDEFYPLGHLPGIRFPVLSRLERLVISDATGFDTVKEIFPPGLSLSTNFPVVRDLKFDLSGPAESVNFWDVIFPFNLINENYWPSVVTVTINHHFQNWIPNLSLLLPNLKNLIVVGYDVNVPLICRGIFGHMKQLESLKFRGISVFSLENKFPAIDSVISGFSPQTCRRLAKYGNLRKVEKLRRNLSILELTGLRTLEISCGFDERILSRASEVLTFPRMPQLTVTTSPR